MFELVAYKAPLRSTIEKYTCICVIQGKSTGNHYGVFNCFPVSYFQDSSHITSIGVPCLWAIPFKIPGLPTAVAGSAHPDIGGVGVFLDRRFTGRGGMPLSVVVATMHFFTSTRVVKVALVALG